MNSRFFVSACGFFIGLSSALADDLPVVFSTNSPDSKIYQLDDGSAKCFISFASGFTTSMSCIGNGQQPSRINQWRADTLKIDRIALNGAVCYRLTDFNTGAISGTEDLRLSCLKK